MKKLLAKIGIILGIFVFSTVFQLIVSKMQETKEYRKDIAVLEPAYINGVGVRPGFRKLAYNNTHDTEEELIVRAEPQKKELTESPTKGPAEVAETVEVVDTVEAEPSLIGGLSEDEWYEISLMAQTMFNEAGGTGNSAQIKAVGATILYRVNDSDYPDTVREVVFQNAQYAAPNGRTSDECQRLAKEVYLLWKENRLSEIIPEGYLYFYGDGVSNHFYNDAGSYITPL